MPAHGADNPFAHVSPTLDRLRHERREQRILRLSVPPKTIAFSRRDERNPNFEHAAQLAREAGYVTVTRLVGGTFAPLHEGSLVVDEFGWSAAPEWPNERFDRHSELLADVYRSYGIDARVGEVPGEYCPGAHSVNREGRVKLSGTAQRVARGAWVVSSVVQVEPTDALRDITAHVAEALGTVVDLSTLGALTDTVPDITMDDVATRIAERFSADGVAEVESLL